MSRALWSKSFSEARLLLAALTALMFGFMWLFVWLTNQVKLDAYAIILQHLPPAFEKLAGVPFANLVTYSGRIAMAYVDPVVLLASLSWSISRGSDVVSGEIGRGTMEMLLAQPVRRISVIFTQAAVTTLGAAVLALAALLGTGAGLKAVGLSEQISLAIYIPGAVNLFALMFFLAGASTLMSSWDNHRWRTIGLMVTFYVVELVIKVIARLANDYHWLMNFTFLGAFDPQTMIIDSEHAWTQSLWHDGILIGTGLAAYVAAAIVFARRDLPAPI
jgi:ABC-2 type transport system permease protein